MLLIVGFYENAIFCEINKFLEKSITGLAKTTKTGLLYK